METLQHDVQTHAVHNCPNRNLNRINNSSSVVVKPCSHVFIWPTCSTRKLMQKRCITSIYPIHLTGEQQGSGHSKRGKDIIYLALKMFINYRDLACIQHCRLGHSGGAGAGADSQPLMSCRKRGANPHIATWNDKGCLSLDPTGNRSGL